MRASIRWNGGRNGWASFIVGFGWMPSMGALVTPQRRRAGIRRGLWGLHLYLGLWVITLQGVPVSANSGTGGDS